jgi:fluoroquinolone transport system permease protein
MRLFQAFKFDVKFQFRHGFYYAYGFVSLLYVGLLRALPMEFRERITTLLITSDPAVLGMFFVGGMVLLERGQNIFESLFVTPLRVREYLVSKAISLTLLSVVTCFLIATLTFGLDYHGGLFFLGIVLTSVLFTLLGIGTAVRARSLNGFSYPSKVPFCSLAVRFRV